MITKKINELLQNREFVSVATCAADCRPNVAPKFVLKLEQRFLYLIDYVLGTTYRNIQSNPRASVSIMDTESLIGYQLNGSVQIIESGQEYEKIEKELVQREIDLSTKRIIEGVTHGKVHDSFELAMPDKFVVLKLKIEEIVEISRSGSLKREVM
jgi:predicted pyridoxine 5'-phosphate oxidase superfamily flavin-nucleotide-binding protein